MGSLGGCVIHLHTRTINVGYRRVLITTRISIEYVHKIRTRATFRVVIMSFHDNILDPCSTAERVSRIGRK